MEQRYNTRSPAVKRLMREAQELSEPTDQYYAQPLEDNLFEWHFTVRGPADTDFQGGIFHGRIILPVDYPMKPPSIIWLTPNGRFETNKKICLSISGHHPESWQPSWSIRTALLAIIGFMPTHPGGAIGSLDYKPDERKVLAKKSRDWKCPTCGDVSQLLLEVPSEPSQANTQASQEARELASQIAFQGEKPTCKEAECPVEKVASSCAAPVSQATSNIQGVSNNSCVNASTSVSHNFLQASGPCHPCLPPPCSGIASTVPDLGTIHCPFSQPFLNGPCWMPSMMNTGQRDSGVAAMIPRFPYPPSHYPGGYSVPFYPPGLAPPPGVGMFPCPFPPTSPRIARSCLIQAAPMSTHCSSSPISVNNSSVISSNAGQTLAVNRTSPSTSPVPSNPPTSPASSGAAENSVPNTPTQSPIKANVLSELLTKVKRIGSDQSVEQGSSVDQESPASVHPEPLPSVDPSSVSQAIVSRERTITQLSSSAAGEGVSSKSEDAVLYDRLVTSQATLASNQNIPSMDRSLYLLGEASKATSVGLTFSSSSEEVADVPQGPNGPGDHMKETPPNPLVPQVEKQSQAEKLDESQVLRTVSESGESASNILARSLFPQAKEENTGEGEAVAKETVAVYFVTQAETTVPSIQKQDVVGDSSIIEELPGRGPDSIHGNTDSEVSLSLKKRESLNDLTGTEASHSDLPADGEEISDAAALPTEMSEADQKSNIEKSTSSSMSDLEKMRKLGSTKTLRQRQSATARIPQEVDEDEAPDPSPPASGQRIEAASGDTTNRNPQFLHQGVRALNEARQIHREALAQVRQRQSPYDASFLLMVSLFVGTVFIILNRIFHTFDWADMFGEF